jgi:hypothetical protein
MRCSLEWDDVICRSGACGLFKPCRDLVTTGGRRIGAKRVRRFCAVRLHALSDLDAAQYRWSDTSEHCGLGLHRNSAATIAGRSDRQREAEGLAALFGVDLFSVSKLTVRIPSKGALSVR